MIDTELALEKLADAAGVLPTEAVPLDLTFGRVLAEKVVADRDFPPTDRSAMDGFAVRAADFVDGAATLRLVGEVRAGQKPFGAPVEAGQAVKIMTGAIVPEGADAVVMVERTREDREAAAVTCEDDPKPGQHIRRRAEELRSGQTVLEPGSPIHPAEIAALASVGCTRVDVYRRPQVAILSTGDEVVEPNRRPSDHQVRNSNGYALQAQLREMRIDACYLGIADDDRKGLGEALSFGLDTDLLLITGGVSAGEYDLVGKALADRGVAELFHKVAMKPGKPILAGRGPRGVVVGLPGNPLSAYTGFAVLVAPVLRRMMGLCRWRNSTVPARLAGPLRNRPGRRTFHLARIEPSAHGVSARPVRSAGSGDVLSMARANGFVVTEADRGSVEEGAELPALLWNEFQLR